MPHPTAIATSGALPMSEIRNWLIAAGELANTTTVSLESLVNASHLSDKTRPHNISLFYGYGVVMSFPNSLGNVTVGNSENVCLGATGGNYPASSNASPTIVGSTIRVTITYDLIPSWGSFLASNGIKYQITVDDRIAFTSTYRYYKVLAVFNCSSDPLQFISNRSGQPLNYTQTGNSNYTSLPTANDAYVVYTNITLVLDASLPKTNIYIYKANGTYTTITSIDNQVTNVIVEITGGVQVGGTAGVA